MNRRVFWALAWILSCGVVFSSFAAEGPISDAPGKMVRHAPSARGTQMRELHQRLRASEPATLLDRQLTVTLSAAEKATAEPLAEGRYRVGASKPVALDLDFSRNLVFGARELRADGSLTWTGIIRSPGASALRVHFSPFDLPEGAELYVYGPDRQAFGPYTGRGPIDDGELWTNTVWGEEVRLQLRLPAGVTRARLLLADIGYMGKAFPRALATITGFCPSNASCVVNASCASNDMPATVQAARDAIADMLFVSGAYYYLCTGGLIADKDSNSTVPYFLTANHCISKAGEASSLETYFDYVADCSNPDCTAPFDQSPRDPDTLGAVIKSANRTGDYTLLQLSSVPDTTNGVEYYLGWTSTAVANSNGVNLYRISHPQGSPQAYSSHVVDTTKVTCGSWPRGNWIYSRDVVGATEGGSSGSPVLNAAGQVVGQLSGACGYNVNDVCDVTSNATVDGAFASYYSQVAPFLGGGGSQCRAARESCSMNSECCSNSCKGKPGTKTCK